MKIYSSVFLLLLLTAGTSFLWKQQAAKSQSNSIAVTATLSDSIIQDSTFDPNNIQTPTLYNDTLFLRRKVIQKDNYTSYNYVYVDSNRNAPDYSRLTNFTFSHFDSLGLKSYVIEDVSSSDDLAVNTTSGLPRNWLPLYSLDGEYVVYTPSDFGNTGRRIITSNYFIYWYMDGPMPFTIVSQKFDTSSNSFELSGPMGESFIMTLYCIDKQRQIYLLENLENPEGYKYHLYIPAGRAKDFNMVVNTGNEKAREYEFDAIDYPSLLGVKKQ